MAITLNAPKDVFPLLDEPKINLTGIRKLLQNYFLLEVNDPGVIYVYVDWFGDAVDYAMPGSTPALVEGDDKLTESYRNQARRILPLLKSKEPEIRKLAAALLAHLPTQIYLENIGAVSQLLEDKDSNVRKVTSYYLANDTEFYEDYYKNYITPTVVQALGQAMLDKEDFVVFYAMSTAQQIGPGARPLLGSRLIISTKRPRLPDRSMQQN